MHPVAYRKLHLFPATLLLPVLFFLSACASKPLNPWTVDSPPLALVPVADAGVDCSEGDGGALDSLRPAIRRSWLAHNPLPDGIVYYSLVSFPSPDRISSVLGTTYRKLSQVDARNDSQLLYYDRVIPGSTLLGFLNADHWAVAVPIARSHSFIGSSFVDKNDYPREAMVEAVLRFVGEDLKSRLIQ